MATGSQSVNYEEVMPIMQEIINANTFEKYPDVLTVKQLQSALNIGRSCAYGLINEGQIPFFKVGKTIRIPKTGLLAYLHDSVESCYNGRNSDWANLGCQKGIGENT